MQIDQLASYVATVAATNHELLNRALSAAATFAITSLIRTILKSLEGRAESA